MKIALAQLNTPAGDFEATYKIMESYGMRAQEQGAQLVVYPAPTLMGPDPMALIDDAAYLAEAYEVLERLARLLTIDAIVPFMAGSAGSIEIDAAFLHAGEVVVPNSFGRLGPFEVADTEVGIAFSSTDLAQYRSGQLDADVICYLSPAGYNGEDDSTMLAPAVAKGAFTQEASECDSWIAAVGASGAYEDYVYVGGSFVMAPSGELVCAAHNFTEELICAEVGDKALESGVSSVEPKVYERTEMLWDACTLAVRDQVLKRGLKGAVLALDGSLASSITAAIATDALGPMRVSACICARGSALQDARALAKTLRIHEVEEVSYNEIDHLAYGLSAGGSSDAVLSSLISLRLASFAKQSELLLLSSADKTGLALGEDLGLAGAPSFAPFGDVYRSDTLSLARWRNVRSALFSPSVLGRFEVPSNLDLDLSSMTAEYALGAIDASLLYHFERGATAQELALLSRQSQEFLHQLFERLHKNAAFRRFAPSYPVVSSRSLDEVAAPVTDAWIDKGKKSSANPAFKPSHAPFAHSSNSDEPDLKDLDLSELPFDLSELEEHLGQGAIKDVTPEELTSQISEIFGLLQELSDANRLDAGKGSGQGGSSQGYNWLGSLFSDN